MKILSIIGGEHSCGIAYIENGEIIFSFEEERHIRLKAYKDYYNHTFRYPLMCLQEAKKFPGFNWEEIDYITSFFTFNELKEWWEAIESVDPSLNLPLDENKFIKVDHHESHCALAYYCSGFQEPTLVISLDASGENYCGKYYLGDNGNFYFIDGIEDDKKSLGHYYCMLTELLGFKRIKDEGKIVGMSSYGKYNENFYQLFDKSILLEGWKPELDKGSSYFSGVYEDFYANFFKLIGSQFWSHHKNDLAYNGQLVFEDKIISIINQLKQSYPEVRKIALAGGVFANIKLNKRINELDWVEEVFIAPPMGDEGLCLGSALIVHKHFTPDFKPFKLKNVFLGTEYSDESFIYDTSKFVKRPYNPRELAYDLKEGVVVGWFQGRYEHGPRALCNRSIIADPSIPGTYKKINDKLQRNDFMPFAPVVIDKYANEVFNITKSSYTAEFMTMLYDTKEEWQNRIPAVVHPVDKTARIQIVTKNSNPKFYELINEFNNITEIPVLLNTSFNVHGEPIVCKPQDAFVHLDNGIVDKLVINNYIYTKH